MGRTICETCPRQRSDQFCCEDCSTAQMTLEDVMDALRENPQYEADLFRMDGNLETHSAILFSVTKGEEVAIVNQGELTVDR